MGEEEGEENAYTEFTESTEVAEKRNPSAQTGVSVPQSAEKEDGNIMAGMENKRIAGILRETARLLEIDGAIIGRYRSYEKAAELIDGLPDSV